MAVRPAGAEHHQKMIRHHVRELGKLAGKSAPPAVRSGKMPSEGTKARSDAKGAWPTKKK